jgi:hypothetical protein
MPTASGKASMVPGSLGVGLCSASVASSQI